MRRYRYLARPAVAGLAFALVVGCLVPGWWPLAGVAAVAYLMLAGLVDGQGPQWGTFAWCSVLLLLGSIERMARADETGGVLFVGCAALAAVAAVLLGRPPFGTGGPVGHPAGGQHGEMPADARGPR